MTERSPIACRLCVFWRAKTPDDAQALCYRFPGTVVAYPESKLDLARGEQTTEWKLTVMLPPKAAHEWCGEFQPRPVSPLQ